MATSKEIAEMAGVSRGTVDRVLHGRGGVKHETAQRIRKIAAELSYVPDRAGRALRFKSRSIKIGVVYFGQSNPFFDDVKAGIAQAEAELSDFSPEILIRPLSAYSGQAQLEAIESLEKEGIDALVLTPLRSEKIAAKINALYEKGIPAVCMNSDLKNSKRIAYVGCDYEKSGALAAQLVSMFTRGSAKTVMVLGSFDIAGHCERRQGFEALCQQEYTGINLCAVTENNDDDARSFAVTKELIQKEQPQVIYFAAGGLKGGLEAVTEYYGAETKPIIIACDETECAISALKQGLVSAVISQQPVKQGRLSVLTAFNAAVNHCFPEHEMLYTKNEIIVKHSL